MSILHIPHSPHQLILDCHQTVFTAGGVTDFRALFLLPLLTAIGAAVLLALAFRPPARPEPEEGRP